MKEKLYNELAPYYDLFNFNDYKKQTSFVTKIINKEFYSRKTKNNIKILDLACGTGEHIKILKRKFEIEGIDVNKGMVKKAKSKNPTNMIKEGNICNLNLKYNYYDVVVCFSSSIQYILSEKDLESFFKKVKKSLKNQGIFIFDMAYCKEKWIEGYVGIRTVVRDGLQIAEIFKSRSKNNISYYDPIYLINNNGRFRFYIDNHKIYLFSIKKVKNILRRYFLKNILYGDFDLKEYNYSKHKTPVFVCKK